MLEVFSVFPDLRCQILEPANPDKYVWVFDGTPVSKTWHSVKMYVPNPLLPKPDVWSIGGGTHFAFEESATRHLQTFLDKAGEQLPLKFEGRTLTVLNITNVMNVLDRSHSVLDEDLGDLVLKYSFFPNRLDNTLFKLPETRFAKVYCVGGMTSDGDEFKALFEKHDLKGLRFQKVWPEEKSKNAVPGAKKKRVVRRKSS